VARQADPPSRPDHLPETGLRQTGPVTDLLALAEGLPTRTVPAGDVLMAEGSGPGPMYVLVSGAAAIERDGVAFARILHPGAVFGEMSVVLDRPATATVRAQTDLVVHEIADPQAFFRERPDAALAVLRMTAERLDGMTRYLVDVKAQFAQTSGHLGMVDQILDVLVHHQAPAGRTGSVRDPEGDHQH
jgi:CRP/FNR family transcriptional regulator, cyclic AMP receptor protein